MSKMKKLGALLFALVLILSIGVPTYAVADLTGDGIVGDFTNDAVSAQNKSVKLYKEITAYNPTNSTVNAPTISYTYTVTPGSADKELFDVKTAHNPNANAHALTKAGITTGVTVNSGTTGDATSATGTVAWDPSTAADQLTASSAGTKNTKPITIDFSNVTFTGAGVYRYTITETATTYGSSGVVDGGISNVRYLDVYVKDGTGTGASAYDIYGYVCFTNDNNIDAQDTPTATTPNTVAAAVKTEGFVAVDLNNDSDYEDANESADRYYTYNVTIGKTLAGDQAKNSHEFPFKVQFANTTVTANVLPIVSGTAGTQPTLTAGALSSFTIDGQNGTATQKLKIANGQTVTFTGIPCGTTVTINEYNDVTGTVYTTKTSGGTTNETTGVTLADGTWTNAATGWDAVTALKATANTNSAADANVTVTFTNTLLLISPTGVVLRVAPYAIMLGMGILLLIVVRRRRPEEEAMYA